MARQWDVFCRVVDNFGDVGVCWRLAADLASRGLCVRLVIDDSRALEWMAPRGCDGVTVVRWEAYVDGPRRGGADPAPGVLALDAVGDVVIEAFGCDLPERALQALAARAARGSPAVWINLEYLSAEADVERSHRLPSPQMSGPAAGLVKWFFYPGFTSGTGGLLREPGTLEARDAFDRSAWSTEQELDLAADQHAVSVFAYDVTRLQPLLGTVDSAWAAQAPTAMPTQLLVTAGLTNIVAAALADDGGASGQPDPRRWRARSLPWLTQPGFDRLLWAADLNLVRGEDSFVRAQWSGNPFIWQIYPQHDDVHRIKLDAFLERFLDGAELDMAEGIRRLWMLWNGFGSTLPAASLPPRFMASWSAWCRNWRDRLASQPDLTSQLIDFVAETR